MKVFLYCLSISTFFFFIYLARQEFTDLNRLTFKNKKLLTSIEKYYATRFEKKTSQVVSLEKDIFCDNFVEKPFGVYLFDNNQAEVYITPRPDMSFSNLKPLERGSFSIHGGKIKLNTINPFTKSRHKRSFYVLELDKGKRITTFSIEYELSSENCL